MGINQCPAGTTWTGELMSCLKCAPGMTATAGEACHDCVMGTYCPTAGTGTPQSCPIGSFCKNGSVLPLLCSAGSSNSQLGGADAFACKPWPKGSSQPRQAGAPASFVGLASSQEPKAARSAMRARRAPSPQKPHSLARRAPPAKLPTIPGPRAFRTASASEVLSRAMRTRLATVAARGLPLKRLEPLLPQRATSSPASIS